MEDSDGTMDENHGIVQLWACAESLKETKDAVGFMLDDVMVASGLPERQDILMAWTEGHDHVRQHRAAVSQFVEEALGFMGKDDFNDLDGAEKVAYWETYTETEKALEGVDSRISFYRTLSLIEHTEQTISFLWTILKRHRNVAMRKEDAGELVSRGLNHHKKKLQLLRNRLRYEMQNVMKLITAAIKNENFSSVPKAKQEEYSAKWKTYNVQLGEIDFE